MITLIIGTPGSGKSALAEELALQTGDAARYYLATMMIRDADGEERVRRHQKRREGKGFVTLERYCAVAEAGKEMEDLPHATVLLECVSNLVGNEMHDADGCRKPYLQDALLQERFADEVARDIEVLGDSANNMILVTNEFAPEGEGYDDETRLYVKLLDLVNRRLAAYADRICDLRPAASHERKEKAN